MKRVICISLGESRVNYEFETEFLGQDFFVKRVGTDGDYSKAESLLTYWDKRADAIGIGSIRFPYTIGPPRLNTKQHKWIAKMSARMSTPITTGDAFRKVSFEWSIRHLQYKMNEIFTNARVIVLSGLVNYNLASILSEFTDNLIFADPLLEHGIPKLLNSLKDVERYANGVHEVLQYTPGKRLATSTVPIKKSVKDHALCGVPLRKKAGRCHTPQMIPRMSPAHRGDILRCSTGSANPLHPISSTGPLIANSRRATR